MKSCLGREVFTAVHETEVCHWKTAAITDMQKKQDGKL
jgi:hypothetical protein